MDKSSSVNLDDSNDKGKSAEEGLSEDIQCGYWGWKPHCLQIFNNPKALLAVLCIFSTIRGFVIGSIFVIITSLERRFGLTSAQAGMVASAYDVFAAMSGVVISYFGSRKHKARLVAVACLSMSLGSMVMCIPQFTTGPYQWGQGTDNECKAQSNTDADCTQDSSLQNYLFVFLLAQALHGMGGITLFTVGVTLIDDSVPSTSSPLYVGILLAFSALGPALGFVIGGQILNIYVDFYTVTSVDLTPDDPLWVGAWWLGFTASCVLCVMISLPLLAYGAELPTAQNVRATRTPQHHVSDDAKTKEQLKGQWDVTFFKSIGELFRNPAFASVALSSAMESFGAAGVTTFLPKLIQNQFGVTATMAALLAGISAVSGAASGHFVGGLVCKRWKLKVRGMLRFNISLSFSGLILDTIVWMRCSQDIAGVNVPYSSTAVLPNLTSACNSICSCTTDYYEPVCSENNVQYFSPCHAGCITRTQTGYSNCSCIEEYLAINSQNWTSYDVTSGKCEISCPVLYLWTVLLILNIFIVFLRASPTIAITIRCIREDQRAFGLGIQTFISRILGFVPGPIIFGVVIDSACIIWQEKCGARTSCWIYDSLLLSRNFFLILISFKILAGVFYVVSFKFYKPPPDQKKTNEIMTEHTRTSDEVMTEQTRTSDEVMTEHTQTSDEVMTEHSQTSDEVMTEQTRTSDEVMTEHTQTSDEVMTEQTRTSYEEMAEHTQTSDEVMTEHTQTSDEVMAEHTQTSEEVMTEHTQTSEEEMNTKL